MQPDPASAVLVQSWFPGHPSAISQARRFVADVLGDDFPDRDDVLLLVSEIASNAVKHSASGDDQGEFEVAISVAGGVVRVEVGDQGGDSEPRLTEQDSQAHTLTGGRGLRIVDALAAKWGHAGDELGRVVWFEMEGR